MDCERPYNHSCDRIWSAVLGLGYCTARLGCWTDSYVTVLRRDALHLNSPDLRLPDWGPYQRKEELHLHGSRPIQSGSESLCLKASIHFSAVLHSLLKLLNSVLKSNFSGGFRVKMCGVVQYVNLFGVAIGYTIASAISMM